MQLLTITLLAATALAGSDNPTFALAKGERWADGDVAVTLRSISDDSGCLSESDCSQMLFNGTVVIERDGAAPALGTVQAVLTPGSKVDLSFDGGRFELIGARSERGTLRASFRLVMDPPPPPPPRTYLELTAAERREADNAFLAEHAQRGGVHTTPSGLQYAVLDAGGGSSVDGAAHVALEYRAVYTDGSPIVESAETLQTKVPPDDLVPGLREGLLLMSEGSRYRFVVPAAIARDVRGGRGQLRVRDVPDDAVLVFDVRITELTER